MAIGARSPEVIRQLTGQREAGKEERVRFTGEPAPRFHGTLTKQFYEILTSADASRETFGDLERSLQEAFGHDVTVRVADATRDQIVLANNTVCTRADELIARLEEQRPRQIIAGLEEVIARREQQGDYWPEGRLNLGIAYACLGEYENARRWLADAVDMFRSPSYIPRSQQMAA